MNDRIASLEKAVRQLKFLFAAIVLLGTGALTVAFRSPEETPVLRARGLVIVDEAGRERILIGAPVPAAASRVRTDLDKARAAWAGRFPDPDAFMELYRSYEHGTNGILILDEQGHDRIAIGDPTPDLPFGKRIAPATGMAINDHQGFERGGLGLLRVEGRYRVVLGLDDDTGSEGVALVLMDEGPTGVLVRQGEQSCFLGSAPPNAFGEEAPAFHGLTIKEGEEVKHELH